MKYENKSLSEDVENMVNSYLPLELSDKDLRNAFIKEFLRIEKEYLDNGACWTFEYISYCIDKFIRKYTINRFENKNYYIKESKARFRFGNCIDNKITVEFLSDGMKFYCATYQKNKIISIETF